MKNKGLTLVEIIIAMGLVALLTGSVIIMYTSSFRAVDNIQDVTNIKTPLAQALDVMVSDAQNTYGITVCNATTLQFDYNQKGYTLYTADGSTKLLRALPSDSAGTGQVIAKDITSASSTLCTLVTGGLTTFNLTSATSSGVAASLSTSVKHGIAIPANPISQQPYAWWKFDENTGTTAYDSSGNGFTGTLTGSTTGPAWTTGISGSALSFTHTLYDRVTFSAITPAASSAYTITAWFKFTDETDTFQSIFTRSGGTTGTKKGLYGYATVGGARNALAFHDNASTQKIITGAGYDAGVWYHVAITYDDVNNFATLYKNGYPIGSAKTVSGLVSFSRIGWDETAGTYGFYGVLDDLRYYNVLLSPLDIREIYRQYGKGCPENEQDCSGTCRDLNTSASACGICTTTCSGGTPDCSYGKCCASGQTSCNPSNCYNLQTNASHCGYCNNACGGGTPNCVAGVCV